VSDRILRLPAVIARTGMSRATIYRRAGIDFPKPVRLTSRSIGWRESEVDAWISNPPDPGVSTGVSTGSEAA
jgi:prophage regulatory protein